MEYVTGIRLRDIFLEDGNWWKFFLKHPRLIRLSIILNVLKMLVCRTAWLGFHLFVCPKCKHSIKAPHTCKSRFCSSCGKKATDDWIQKSFNTLPDTTWQHITFTLPGALWDFFWVNRALMNELPPLAANIILDEARKQFFYPGIFMAVHTFGRDLKRNYHLHLSTTLGGLNLERNNWVNHGYFHHDVLKKRWRYVVINHFRQAYKKKILKMPPPLKHIKTYTAFNSWLNSLYQKNWVVHLQRSSDNPKRNVEYLGKYLKRPPLGETRIKAYDGKSVTYEFLDHYTNTKDTLTLPVLEFIARLVSHIPDAYFRQIRYYGFLSTRNRGKCLPLVYRLLNMTPPTNNKFYTPWAVMLQMTFNFDPLTCPHCDMPMKLTQTVFRPKISLFANHHRIAHGYIPLLI